MTRSDGELRPFRGSGGGGDSREDGSHGHPRAYGSQVTVVTKHTIG